MNLDQIEVFIYAALTESFSKAGEILFISQPAVSIKIKALEEKLGVSLFERDGKSIYLSNSGRDFFPYAQEVVQNIQKGMSAIQQSYNPQQHEVSIAAVFSSVSYLLPKILDEFHQKHPQIKPVVFTGHSEQVLNMVVENQVSLGIIRSATHSKMASIPLLQDEMILVHHPEHPFHAKTSISLEEISKTPFILSKRETLDWSLVHNAFKQAKLSPNIILEVDSIEGAKRMVQENMGVSILPRFSIQHELQSGSLDTVHMASIPPIYRNVDLIYPRKSQFDEATSTFFNFIHL